jgi:hypothetical protein
MRSFKSLIENCQLLPDSIQSANGLNNHIDSMIKEHIWNKPITNNVSELEIDGNVS